MFILKRRFIALKSFILCHYGAQRFPRTSKIYHAYFDSLQNIFLEFIVRLKNLLSLPLLDKFPIVFMKKYKCNLAYYDSTSKLKKY